MRIKSNLMQANNVRMLYQLHGRNLPFNLVQWDHKFSVNVLETKSGRLSDRLQQEDLYDEIAGWVEAKKLKLIDKEQDKKGIIQYQQKRCKIVMLSVFQWLVQFSISSRFTRKASPELIVCTEQIKKEKIEKRGIALDSEADLFDHFVPENFLFIKNLDSDGLPSLHIFCELDFCECSFPNCPTKLILAHFMLHLWCTHRQIIFTKSKWPSVWSPVSHVNPTLVN